MFNVDAYNKLTFQDALLAKEAIESEASSASNCLKSWDGLRRKNGLLPDAVRNCKKYQKARQRYDAAFTMQRDFNAWFVRTFKAEYAAYRRTIAR